MDWLDLLAARGLLVTAIMCSLSFDFMAFVAKIRSRRWRPLDEKKDLLVSCFSLEDSAVGSREQVRAGRGGGGPSWSLNSTQRILSQWVGVDKEKASSGTKQRQVGPGGCNVLRLQSGAEYAAS